MSLLELTALAASYGDIRALWDVSLHVNAGEVTSLLGRNGAGKTTTLRTVAGLTRLHGGSICLDGRDIGGLSVAARVDAGIAFVQDGKRIFRRLSVEDNLVLGGYAIRRDRRRLAAAVEGSYDLFPVLAERRRHAAGALSGGQQQMLAIAQALVPGPSLLMLDEPSGGLAPAIINDVLDAVRGLKSRGIGVLLVEQAVSSALSVADWVCVMELGRTRAMRPAAEVSVESLVADSFMGQLGSSPSAQPSSGSQ